MKKLLLLGAILVMVALVLTGCGAPKPAEEPSPSPSPTEEPTPYIPTPEPTVTPYPFTDVEWPSDPSATLLSIDPITRPTPKPITLEPYEERVSNSVGISVQVPSYFYGPEEDGKTATFYEPENEIRSETGVPATFIISSDLRTTAQTTGDAEAQLNATIDQNRSIFSNFKVSSVASNPLMGVQDGRYVTITFDQPTPEGPEASVAMRGRILVVPVDRTLYTVVIYYPAAFHDDYVKVYRQLRDTMKEL